MLPARKINNIRGIARACVRRPRCSAKRSSVANYKANDRHRCKAKKAARITARKRRGRIRGRHVALSAVALLHAALSSTLAPSPLPFASRMAAKYQARTPSGAIPHEMAGSYRRGGRPHLREKERLKAGRRRSLRASAANARKITGGVFTNLAINRARAWRCALIYCLALASSSLLYPRAT